MREEGREWYKGRLYMNKIALMGHIGELTIIHQQRKDYEWTDHKTTQPVTMWGGNEYSTKKCQTSIAQWLGFEKERHLKQPRMLHHQHTWSGLQ